MTISNLIKTNGLRIIFLSLLFVLSTTSVYSIKPGAEIKGTIISKSTSQPLEYATVSLRSLPDSIILDNKITDGKGQFCFSELADDDYFIVIQFMGYEKKFIDGLSINRENRQIDLGRIEIQVSVNDLKEIEISGEKNAVTFKLDRTVIDVSKELAAKGGTAVDALQNVTSVQVDGIGNVLLRGSADFTLLINGKPTMMDPQQVLQQTQAETIESIEIITNPSVKYEAKGTAGIIDLKLKKQYKDKTEALLNLSLANGDKYSGSFTLNRQFKKVSAYVSVACSDKTQRTSNWGYRNVFDSDSVYHESIDSKRKINRSSADLKMGADYDMNENSSFSFSAQLGSWKFSRDISSDYQQTADLYSDTILSQVTEEDFLLKNKFLSGDMNYIHLFNNKEGHKLEISGFYGVVINKTTDDFEVMDIPFARRISNSSDRSQFRFTAGYSLPMKHNITFDAGLFSDNQFSAYDYTISNNAETLKTQDFATDFNYSDHVMAAYATISGEMKKWFSYEAGLRLENYRYRLDYENDSLDHLSSATNLFPSVHLSKELSEKHRIGLSYSRRVSRPDEWQLSPVVYSSDSYETRMGNPFLVQSLIDSYEFAYLLVVGKMQLNTSVYYRYSHDPIGNYYLDIDGKFVETYENLDQEISSGIEVSFLYKPLDWLQFRLVADGYHSQWSGVLADGNELHGSSFQLNGSFAPTITIKKNTSLQFLAIYYAPGKVPQGEADAFYYFDFIINQYFMNKKLVLGLRTHNTFDTGLYHYTTSGNTYYAEDWYRYEGPVFILTMSYKLNNFKQKQSKEGVRMDFDSGLDH